MLYSCFLKPSRDYLRGFLIAAWAGAKITEFSFPETSFHFQFSLWLFFRNPRVCGEKYDCSGQKFTNWGSPPRMRGKAFFEAMLNLNQGITHAYAGKSLTTIMSIQIWEDHPRVCGEKGKTV